MKKILFFIVLLLEVPCFGNAYAHLTSINYDSDGVSTAGRVPFDVTIQSSDRDGWVEIRTRPDDNPNIKNVPFNLNDIKNFSFTIPWEGWDGDATLRVKVLKGKELISEMQLQDRNGKVIVIGVKNAESTNIKKTRNREIVQSHPNTASYKDIDCSLNIGLSVDPVTGRISVDYSKAVECDDADQQNRIHE